MSELPFWVLMTAAGLFATLFHHWMIWPTLLFALLSLLGFLTYLYYIFGGHAPLPTPLQRILGRK